MYPYNKTIYKNPAETYLLSLNSECGTRNAERIIKRFCMKISGNGCYLNFDWSKLNYTLLIELKSHYQKTELCSGTINTYIAILKAVAKESWRQKLIDTDDYLHIKEMKRVKGFRTPTGKLLTGEDMKELVNHCLKLKTTIGKRNATMLAITYGAGLRVHELAKLTTDNYIENEIRFIGKGNKERIQPLPAFVINILNKWLTIRPNNTKALFLRIYKDGSISSKKLSERSIGMIFKRIGLKEFSPHDLRRSFATNLLDSGVDVFTVQNLMGHSNVNTTRRYDMRGERVKAQAIKKLPF